MRLESFKDIGKNKFIVMFITVYDKPLDYKNSFVARIFDVNKPTELFIVKDSLEEIREDIKKSYENTFKFYRNEADDKCIVESYLIL